MKLLLYCTKAKKQKDLLWSNNLKHFFLDGAYNRLIDNLPDYLLNGKIVAECDFEVEKINCSSVFNHCYATWNLGQEELLKFSCLERKQLVDYLGYENQIDGKWCGYAIHIKNLHIFDKPKELSEYYGYYNEKTILKAPQNMMLATSGFEDYKGLDLPIDIKILISIRPQWLCKILNGEKIIEVRKKVLKEMLKNE